MKHVVVSADVRAEIKKTLQNCDHCEFHFQSLKAQSQY